MKTCSRCGVVKSFDAFAKSKDAKDGLTPHCRACKTLRNKEYYARNREREKQRAQGWRIENTDRVKETGRKWCKDNAEKFAETKKAYRANNREKVKTARKLAYAKNRDRELMLGRIYKSLNKNILAVKRYTEYWQNPDDARKRQTEYRKNNPSVARSWRMGRIAAKKRATPIWSNTAMIRQAYDAADLLMQLTGEWYEVDHIIPLQSNLVCGLHIADNLQVITREENRRKSNQTWPNMPAAAGV